MRAALSAARRTGRLLKVYAIEKNPNAVVTLHKLVAAERSGAAQICSAKPPKYASSCICNPAHVYWWTSHSKGSDLALSSQWRLAKRHLSLCLRQSTHGSQRIAGLLLAHAAPERTCPVKGHIMQVAGSGDSGGGGHACMAGS